MAWNQLHDSPLSDGHNVPEQLSAFEPCDSQPNIASKPVFIEQDDSTGERSESLSRGFSFTHTVDESDTSLTSIADCYFNDTELGVQSIIAANPQLTNPDVIHTGDKIRIWITSAESLLSSHDRSVADIADATGFDTTTIATLNKVKATNDIIPSGTPIILPRQERLLDGETGVVVHQGDSYSSIAAASKADIVFVQAANSMNAAKLQPGQIVVVPSGDRGPFSLGAPETPASETTDPTPPSADLPPEEQLRQFIESYGPYADAVEKQYHIPAALVLAVSYHESEYGRSSLARKANNFHGLKANGAWGNRPTFDKKTEEYYTKAQYDQAVAEGRTMEIIDTSDGTYHVFIIDAFRKYDSAEDGFLGFGEKLSTEGNYPDAFETDDPYEFLSRLVDDNGPAYATDPNYYDVVSDKIRRVEQVIYEETITPTPENPPTDIEPSTEGAIEAVTLTPGGYESFKNSINTSFMDQAAAYDSYNPATNDIPQEASELFIWHFTTLYYNGGGNSTGEPIGDTADVLHFLSSTANSGVGIQWFIDRTGHTYQLTDPTTRTANIPPHSSVSTGVEIESDTQANITTEQYESAAYLAAYNIMALDLLSGDKSLDEVLYGHAEIRAIDRLTDPSLAGRSDFPAGESSLLRQKVAKLLSELGYNPN